MLALLWCLVAAELRNGAAVVLGAQKATYVVNPEIPGFLVPDYANNGFSQTTTHCDGVLQVQVEVQNRPLRSKQKARVPEKLPPGLESLEHELQACAGERAADQVAVIMDWILREVTYDRASTVQIPEQVLGSGSGNCVGLANLSVFLLRYVGIRARHVTGVAFRREDDVELVLQGNVLHRWIEVYYEDVGWVFSDPTGKVNYVDATYLVLALEGEHALEAVLSSAQDAHVELRTFENGFRSVHRRPDLDSRLTMRPNLLYYFPNP